MKPKAVASPAFSSRAISKANLSRPKSRSLPTFRLLWIYDVSEKSDNDSGVALQDLLRGSVQMPIAESIDKPGPPLCPLFASYTPVPGTFDECATATGAVRPAFRPFSEALPNLTAAELKRRAEIARRIIHEQGVT